MAEDAESHPAATGMTGTTSHWQSNDHINQSVQLGKKESLIP